MLVCASLHAESADAAELAEQQLMRQQQQQQQLAPGTQRANNQKHPQAMILRAQDMAGAHPMHQLQPYH
jgi:hypothetical protein